jgi:hypothetical protein
MIKRSLQEIQDEIKSHKEAIKILEEEVKNFQTECPHPEKFQKVVKKSYDDEYGSIDSYSIKTTCLLCGHADFKTEDAHIGPFR